MAGLELKLFYFINQKLAHPILDCLMPFLAFISEYDYWTILTVILFIFLRKEKKAVVAVLLAGIAASGAAVFILKNVVTRQAPFVALEYVRQVVKEPDISHSLPSGHATCAFLVATIFSRHFGHPYLFYLIATAAAFSRVYGGFHYVSDILIGAIIGIGVGRLVIYAAQKIMKTSRLGHPIRGYPKEHRRLHENL